ncbi:UNVERIFIED_CONTAM: hypothetical protein FKN15_041106 [Acipenser sinensis]
MGGLLAASTSTTRGAAAEPRFAQRCQPRFAQGCQPRFAQGCLPCIAWGCLLLHIAAGSTVAGAPQKGVAGYEEGGRSGDHPPSSLSAARTTLAEGVSLGAVGTSADRWLLATLPPVGPLKPPVLTQDFVLDFWAFKRILRSERGQGGIKGLRA